MPHIRTGAVALLAVPLFVTGCSSTDTPAATVTETVTETITAPADDANDGEGAMAGAEESGTFHLTTEDGGVDVTGTSEGCDNPTETSLAVTFTDGATTVEVDSTDGSGSVVASGDVEFEGTVTSVMVGDGGDVEVSGDGSLSDPGAAPTAFSITGSCA
jgi:hypothetical protein